MDWIRGAPFFCMLLFTTGISSLGQDTELGVNVNAGLAHTGKFDPGMNGFSLNTDYLHSIGENLALKGGLEIGITGWGSQLLIATGIRWGGVDQVELEFLNGMALYQQGPNYVFGAGAYYSRTLFSGNRNRLLLSAGLRFSIQPAYSAYSSVYTYFDLPLRMRWARSLK